MSRLQPESVFRDRAATIVASETARILKLLPHADVQHIGGTSVPGALTKGDVDIVVRVAADGFPTAIAALRKLYTINQPENWTPSFASFKDDATFPLPFGAQLVIHGSADYSFVTLRDRLSSDPHALAGYNAIKREYENATDAAYRGAKGAWIEALLTERATRSHSSAESHTK